MFISPCPDGKVECPETVEVANVFEGIIWYESLLKCDLSFHTCMLDELSIITGMESVSNCMDELFYIYYNNQ